jgi:hypothetical protein
VGGIQGSVRMEPHNLQHGPALDYRETSCR